MLFEDVGGKTTATMRSVFPSVSERDRVISEYGADKGCVQTLARLAGRLGEWQSQAGIGGVVNATPLVRTLPSDREIAFTRVFDAPRAKVFDAFTKPELLKRWYGVIGGWSLPVCEIDPKAGGAYRFVWRRTDGAEMGLSGIIREAMPPERLVSTELFDYPWYPGEGQVTQVLTEQNGRTTLTETMRYETREARDGVLKSPMEQGVAASYDRLAGLLAMMD